MNSSKNEFLDQRNTLISKRHELVKIRSLDPDDTSESAEHRCHMVSIYNELIDVLDVGIEESDSIGRGA